MANTYDMGDLVKVAGVFTDPENDEEPFDPAHVFFCYKKPDNDETELEYGVDPEVVRDDVGRYHALVNTIGGPSGEWFWRWSSTGTGQAADEGSFEVLESNC